MISTPRAGACDDLAVRLAPESLDRAGEALADVTRRRILDTLGALGAGRAVAASRVLAAVQAAAGPAGPAGLLDEVRLLCASVRCSEVDDIDRRSCTTPGSVAVPVALAVAAARGADGRAVLHGVIAGYEAMVRLGEAVGGPEVLRQGTWPSYLGAPLAAAATTAAVLGLDRARTGHALAIATTRAVGSAGRIAAEPTSRWLTFGCAAADGVLAALAAEAGMVGDPLALGGPGPALDLAAFGPDADEPWRIERIDVKPFATARQALPAVEAAQRAAVELGVLPETVDIGVPGAYRAMIDQPEPTGRMTSLMGAAFQIAAALTREELLFDARREDLALPGAGAAIVLATRVHLDEELDAMYPEHWPARVTLRAEGREVQRLVLDPRGSAECPLGWDELRDKHARLGGFGPHLDRSLALCRGLAASEEAAPARELLDVSMQARPQEIVR